MNPPATPSKLEPRVREVLRRHLSDISVKKEPSFDVFLSAIHEEAADASRKSRSLSSQLGRRHQSIVRDLAQLRYGPTQVPKVLYASTVTEELRTVDREDHADTVVATCAPQDAADELANRLVQLAANGSKVGSAAFTRAYTEAIAVLHTPADRSDLWTTRVDLYVESPQIGLCEIESGGELDTSNVKGQLRKLVIAGLAYGDAQIPLRWGLAYANRGEGSPVAGMLPKYLEDSQMLVGSQLWNKVLPEDVSYDRFMSLFKEVVTELDLWHR